MAKNRGRMTPIQIQMLVDILYENSEIASGNVSSSFPREERNKKWEAVATLLNAKGLGPEKTPEQWRKSWADLKCSIRTKAAKIELAGGTDLMNEKLTNLEKRVLQLAGDIRATKPPEKSENEPLTNKMLMKKLEEDLTKTEEDLAKAMKKRNQIVLPISVSKIFQIPEGSHIKLPIVENISAEEKTDDKNDSCTEVSNDDPIDVSPAACIDLDDDSNDDIAYDDSDANEETFDSSAKEPLTPPRKRKKLSLSIERNSPEPKSTTSDKSTSFESKSFVSVFQRQIETQTAVLKEQMSIMRDIAKSLKLIARSLHDS